ncbi:putative bifunctional diguanylate cyclase/phosphodiesterase [Aquimixticola soesokkakensis]|uniref:putative bifunctional diguanylate cyclase/phosphodiesterase n=1 Tax=Aquimixticola soesokkakensis TaxID=1519096 RepID=UPI001F2439C9|nr:bifunctional diguanylate cyclase/phosphodiesterase [Aquimixticola soesokkakensis]
MSLLPILTLLAYWLGGETGLIVAVATIPAVVTGLRTFEKTPVTAERARDGLTNLPLRGAAVQMLEQIIEAEAKTGRVTACLVIELDGFKHICDMHGPQAGEKIIAAAARRLEDAMRDHDLVARLDGPCFAIALAPLRTADLETLIQISSRIQAAIAEPYSIDATKIYVSASVGFCLPSRAPARSGAAFLDAAERALLDAQANGAGAIRSFTNGSKARDTETSELAMIVGDALENGEIRPWFQPQLSTDTGKISGFEALARWEHPEKGLLMPGDFLGAISEAGLMERLGEVMLYHSLCAIQTWDKAGLDVPTVSVNFSNEELANPKLVTKIRWELDRFEIDPKRLTIEVLENVVANSGEDTITRNICQLSELGCGIDLDDFGTGHASIANIRRFAVKRIKIDRSYVTKCDVDRGQQDMLAAILTMAERIDLDTLAEGVETVGEHSMLSQLGCRHVQGFSVSRAICFADTLEWMQNHHEKLAKAPRLQRKTG